MMDWLTLAEYLIDHAAGIVGSGIALFVAFRQNQNQKRQIDIVFHTQEIKHGVLEIRRDLRNGVGETLKESVTQAVNTIVPTIEKAATVAAEKIVAQADKVACELAEKKATWDGVERRVGPPDRRQG